MSRVVLDHIVSRFLAFEQGVSASDFNSLEDVLALPVAMLNEVTQQEAAVYESVLAVRTIKQLADLDPNDPFSKVLPERGDMSQIQYLNACKQAIDEAKVRVGNLDRLQTAIVLAQMISRAMKEKAVYTKKTDSKILCLGLDNAGKTAIISTLGGKAGLDELARLRPTTGVSRNVIKVEHLDLIIWDMGGQEAYRRSYLAQPERHFLNVELVMYIVDMQDPTRYEESIGYIKEILGILKRLGEAPYVQVFFHKSDPAVVHSSEFEANIDYMNERMEEILAATGWGYDMFVTSIYNFFTAEPEFARTVRTSLKVSTSLTDTNSKKIQGIAKVLDTALNGLVTLSSSLGEQVAEMAQRLARLEEQMEWAVSSIQILGKSVGGTQPTKVAAPAQAPSVAPRGVTLADLAAKSRPTPAAPSPAPAAAAPLPAQAPVSPPTTAAEPEPRSLPSGIPATSQSRMDILNELQNLLKKRAGQE